jgi:hypothetical protein
LRHVCSADAGGAAAAAAAAAEEEQHQQQVDPFSEDDLRDLTAADSSLDDEALGEAWRSAFEDDLDGLYGYVDRCGRLQLVVKLSCVCVGCVVQLLVWYGNQQGQPHV